MKQGHIESNFKASGIMDIRVRRCGVIKKWLNAKFEKWGWNFRLLGRVINQQLGVPNLLLNGAISNTALGGVGGNSAATHTSTTPNYDDMNGTYTLGDSAGTAPGNIIKQVTGTGVFAAGDVGKALKIDGTERCYVTVYTSPTQVTVSGAPRNLVGKPIRRYNTVASSSGSTQTKVMTGGAATSNLTSGIVTATGNVVFDPAVSSYTVGSVFIGSKARVVLPVPQLLQIGDQLDLTYTLQSETTGRETRTIPLSSVISGYPVPFPTATISGNGTTITVTTSAAHNLLAGDLCVIKDAIPLRKAVTSASSNSTTWTIISPGHGFSPADSVVHAGFSVSAYNITATVASVVDANTYTVTNASNPGASTGGTTRLATPATYFNGNFTVATAPNVNTVTISGNITGPAADTSSILTTPDQIDITIWGRLDSGISGSFSYGSVLEANKMTTPSPYTDTFPSPPSVAHGQMIQNNPSSGNTNVNASYTNEFVGYQELISANDWSAGGSTQNRVAQILMISSSYGSGVLNGTGWLMTFRTPQPKLSTHRLKYPRVLKTITPELP